MISRKAITRDPEAESSAERPTLRSVAPLWAALTDKYAELTAREEQIELEFKRLVPELNKLGAFASANNIPAPPRPAEPTEHDPKIVSMLGKLVPKKATREPVRPAWHALKAHGAELSDELDNVRLAKNLLLPEIRREHLAGSAELCRLLSPQYSLTANRVCSALVELAEAALENEAFLDDIRKQGAAFSMLRPVLVQSPDAYGDPVAKIARLLDWASLGGWFQREDIPQEWSAR